MAFHPKQQNQLDSFLYTHSHSTWSRISYTLHFIIYYANSLAFNPPVHSITSYSSSCSLPTYPLLSYSTRPILLVLFYVPHTKLTHPPTSDHTRYTHQPHRPLNHNSITTTPPLPPHPAHPTRQHTYTQTHNGPHPTNPTPSFRRSHYPSSSSHPRTRTRYNAYNAYRRTNTPLTPTPASNTPHTPPYTNTHPPELDDSDFGDFVEGVGENASGERISDLGPARARAAVGGGGDLGPTAVGDPSPGSIDLLSPASSHNSTTATTAANDGVKDIVDNREGVDNARQPRADSYADADSDAGLGVLRVLHPTAQQTQSTQAPPLASKPLIPAPGTPTPTQHAPAPLTPTPVPAPELAAPTPLAPALPTQPTPLAITPPVPKPTPGPAPTTKKPIALDLPDQGEEHSFDPLTLSSSSLSSSALPLPSLSSSSTTTTVPSSSSNTPIPPIPHHAHAHAHPIKPAAHPIPRTPTVIPPTPRTAVTSGPGFGMGVPLGRVVPPAAGVGGCSGATVLVGLMYMEG
ncbi:hypothetical protein FA15DRAFT_431803 [Coprinopsis marcescibilis]|uniref:Uncharacterized protein n=1 Tax=Coprinopsis marcescibilis TaxID=230819 RepID=A0A5C3KU63_COPMA|nr:hypothetical protein FA15DRAFT_431803 [Coprinopsis marcescibilis]